MMGLIFFNSRSFFVPNTLFNKLNMLNPKMRRNHKSYSSVTYFIQSANLIAVSFLPPFEIKSLRKKVKV
jgi:hypothetical protein